MLRLSRPADALLQQVLSNAAAESPTYDEVGATRSSPLPRGYHHVRAERVIGRGEAAFERAASGLRDWAAHRGAGLSVVADGPVLAGTTVAMAAPLPVGFAIATCRVVYIEDTPDRFAFAYGTLSVHPECGEERFEVTRTGDEVVFRVTAFSRPQELLARLASPIARRLQAKTTRAYFNALATSKRVTRRGWRLHLAYSTK